MAFRVAPTLAPAGFPSHPGCWVPEGKLAFQHICFGPENPTCLLSPPLRCADRPSAARPAVCSPSERGFGQSSSFAETQFSTLDNEAQSVLKTADWPVRGHAVNAARGPPPVRSSTQLSLCPSPWGLGLASPATPSPSNAPPAVSKGF